MRLLLLFLLAFPALASQALVIHDTDVMHFHPTTGWTSVLDFRFEIVVNACTIPAAAAEIFQGYTKVRIQNDGSFLFKGFNNEDVLTAARATCSNVRLVIRRDTTNALYTNQIWDESTGAYAMTSVAMTDTSAQNMSGFDLNLGKTFLATGPSIELGAFRMYSSAGALSTTAPPRKRTSGFGDMLDYEFNGNLLDSSGHNYNLTFDTGSASYATMAALPPVAGFGSLPATVRAGEETVIDASASFSNSDSAALSFQWVSLNSQPALIVDRLTATPAVTLPAFGEYTLKLVLTDSDGLSTSSYVTLGAVATDDNGVVVIPDANISRLLGPLIRMNKDPWTWADDRAVALAELQIGMLYGTGTASISPWANRWDVYNSNGTVSVTNASPTLTGSSSQFKNDACNGNTTPHKLFTQTIPGSPFTISLSVPVSGMYNGILSVVHTSGGAPFTLIDSGTPTTGQYRILGYDLATRLVSLLFAAADASVSADIDVATLTYAVIWYDSADYSGTTGRAFYPVDACGSDTSITLHYNWGHTSAPQSGLHYSFVNPGLESNGIGWWLFSNTPGNYYDNVLALYGLYYRTGRSRYRDAARLLAHNFWYGPFYDRGKNYDTAALGGAFISAGPARGQSPTGLILWALESGENIWPGIHRLWDWQKYVVHDFNASQAWNVQVGDIRESGYATAALALCAQYDTDTTPVTGYRAVCLTALQETLDNLWMPLQVTGAGHGNWRNTNTLAGMWAASNGSVFVSTVAGSPTITLHGTTWGTGAFPAGTNLWFFNDSTGTLLPGNSNGAIGDTVYYTATYASPTTATLDRNYAGTTGNHGLSVSYLAGFGTQPFMQGIWGGQAGGQVYNALVAAADTTRANVVKQFSIDSALWLISSATSIGHRIYTGAEFLNCDPLGSDFTNCGDGEVLNAEVMKNFSVAYLHSGQSATIKTAGDALYTRMWCKPTGGWACGTPGYGSYNFAVDDYPTGYQTNPADPLSNKWNGYNFGYGANSGWAAARLGPPISPALKDITFGCNIVAPFHDVVVGYARADGTRTSATFTAGPCTLTDAADTRQGSLVTVDFTYRSTDLATQRRGTGSAIVN